MTLISGEEYLWNSVSLDYTDQTVNQHAFYWFEDTSASGIGNNKDIPITFYYTVQQLPYNLTNGNVDWCNLTITHFRNIYGTQFVAFEGFFGGELLNTTIEIQNVYFTTAPVTSGQITVNIRSRDTINADMKCHYENVSDLYEDNILVGMLTTYMPSFECMGCDKYDFEELSNQITSEEAITLNEVAIYERIQTAIDWNFQIWLILSWVIKIVFLLLAVGLIFSGVYFFYIFLKKISQEI
jgi:hypothetical protein